jgi:hypothetical protein
MKAVISAVILLALTPAFAQANDCRERFTEFLVGSLNRTPGESRIVTKSGKTESESVFLFVSRDHSLVKPVKPASPQWTLTYMGAIYQSPDQGRTWKKVGNFDRETQHAQQLANIKEQAKAARDLECDVQKMAGATYDVYEVKLPMIGQPGVETQNVYMVDRATRIAIQSVTQFKMGGVETITTQHWKHAPNLSLPKAE